MTPVGSAAGLHWKTLPVPVQLEHAALALAVQFFIVGAPARDEPATKTAHVVKTELKMITKTAVTDSAHDRMGVSPRLLGKHRAHFPVRPEFTEQSLPHPSFRWLSTPAGKSLN
jgi:hypothetical protein